MITSSLFLERLRRPEVEAALDAGVRTVVVPCGAVEQHGPHLPLFVDAEHGTRLGEEVARRLGDALVAPTIRVDCSEHHLAFAGTLSLREQTFRAVCEDYCTSLAHHGFRYICLLPSHGGNCEPLARMVDDLDTLVGPGCTVAASIDLVGALREWQQIVEQETGHGDRVGGHADVAESSVMLVLHPDLVREDLAEEGFTPELTDDVLQRIIHDGLGTVTPNGILGDARGMSLTIGHKCITALADLAADYFERHRPVTNPPLHPTPDA